MISRFATPLRYVLLAVLAMSPLHAQLDSRLVMSTDSMDVYKNPITVKPEILAVIDMTGSTAAVTWHPNYTPPSNYSYSMDNQTSNIQSSDGSSPAALPNTSGATTFSVTYGGHTYTNVRLSLTVPVVNTDYGSVTAGSFIMSDGTPVETWLLTHQTEYIDASGNLKVDASGDTSPIRSISTSPLGSGSSSSNPKTWTLLPNHRYFALKATHGRMTYNSKTIDIPIPWKIFDTPSSVAGTAANYSTSQKLDPQSPSASPVYVKFDTRDGRPGVSGGTFSSAVCMYNDNYFTWVFTGSNVPAASTSSAWANGMPALTRLQAMKRAVLSTWLDVQTQVYWAISALDNTYDNSTVNSNPTSTRRQAARILADNTSAAIAWLQGQTSSDGTPLTWGLARGYAEMMDGSVFATSRASDQTLNPCRKQFVILFTDGLDSNTVGTGDPFKNSTVSAAGVYSGVTTVKTNPSRLNNGGTYWNIWSFAGLAANGNGTAQAWTPTKTSGTGSISDFAPFSIVSRDGGNEFSPHHPIETLTIGVSMFGAVGTTGTSKNALLLAAGYGTSGQTNFTPTSYVPWNDTGSTGTKVRFWDCQNAASVSTSLEAAIKLTMTAPPTTTSPVAPLSGLKAGDQVYFARYQAVQDSPFWSGDLLMVRSQTSGTTVSLKGLNGTDITGQDVTASNAIWAASSVLANTTWSSRKVYTYIGSKPAAGATANRYASLDQSLLDSSCAFSTSNSTLVTYMTGKSSPSAAELSAQQTNIQWVLGSGRTSATPTTAEGAAILGDIINSTPVVINYDPSSSNLTAAGLTVPSTATGTRLRVIFVGTNHGMLHAFAEASYYEGTPAVLKAVAKELWAFIPKEFAKGVSEQLKSGSAHVYMVDGAISGYLDESKSTAGYVGVVDNTNDKAMVIFGLGKGGRSIYALDVSSLTSPVLKWMLRPDDETGTNANPAIANMGMSTGMSDQAKIRTSTTSGGVTTYAYKDLLFINGGLSTSEVDTNFSTRLGRSILAVETQTGTPYQTWDFLNDTFLSGSFPSMGSIPAGPMALEVLTGTSLAQRVYFADRSGGVYALGCGKQQAVTTTNPGFRLESSDPKEWVDTSSHLSVRKLFQANTGEFITTSPVPFRLPYGYPGTPISGKSAPQAVGVAVGTGDFWDPMDRDANNPAQIVVNTEYNRLIVLFDRNDSNAMGYDTSGMTPTDLTSPGTKIVPGASDYYLKTSDGYFVGFGRRNKPAGQAASETANGVSLYYYDKIVSEPLVFRGAVYFTLLKPDVSLADGTCSGVSKSVVYRVNDVMNPSWVTSVPSSADASGALWTFAGIPGKLSVLSPNMVGIAGTMMIGKDGSSINNGAGALTVGTDVRTIPGPKVRMRSWRIVR